MHTSHGHRRVGAAADHLDHNSSSPCVETLCDMIKSTVIKWGQARQIHDSKLIRAMFKLIYNQYDGIGEVQECLST